jgi:hypothetical protein
LADNVNYNEPGTGTVIATDQVGGTAHYQLIKLAFGPLDTATLVTATVGLPVAQVGTWTVTGTGGSFPVTDSGGSLTVDNAGTFAVQATLAAETTKVIGTVNVASGQTIALAAGSAVVGHVVADSGSTTAVTGNVATTVADGANVTFGSKADPKSTATDSTAVSIMAVLKQISASCQAPPSSAVTNAGTFAVQAALVKDTGRTAVAFSATGVAAGATGVETAITLVKSAGTAATSSAASFVVTSGKKLRITSVTFASRGHATATAQVTTFSLRLNTGGAVATTSTPVLVQARTATPATASAWDRLTVPLPDGYEITGDGTLQIGITANSVFVTNAPTWDVLITGFEY